MSLKRLAPRAGLIALVGWSAAGCSWHWPGSKASDGRPFTSGHERESLGPLEIGFNFATSLVATVLIHEGGHALAAELSGARDVGISLFSGDRIGETSFRGTFSNSERNFIDLAGVGATYLTAELLEWALAKDAVPDGLRPWTATLAMTNKADLYLQTIQGTMDDGSDFDKLNRRSGVPQAAFVGGAAADFWFHQHAYFDLAREATSRRKDEADEKKPDGEKAPEDEKMTEPGPK